MLILKIVGCVVLALLTTLGVGYVFLYLFAKSLGLVGRKGYLPRTPSLNTSNKRSQERETAEYSIYSHYLSKIGGRVLKGISHVLHIYTQQQNKKRGKPYSETSPKGFVPRRPFPHWRPFSKSCHIRTIVNKLRNGGETMTKSNNLVDKVALFAIGLGIGVFCMVVRTHPMLPIELQVALVVVSVAALFVGLFLLRDTSKDYQPNTKKDCTTDKDMAILVFNYPNKSTGYHQTYAKPFHMFLSLLRHIIGYIKGIVLFWLVKR